MTTPTPIDIRLEPLSDGYWRVIIGDRTCEVDARNLPAMVHALVRDIVSPRNFARSRFDACPVTDRAES